MLDTQLMVVEADLGFEGSPSAKVTYENSSIAIELRYDSVVRRVSFRPVQAVRITTADCFLMSGESFISPRSIMEVRESKWLLQLSDAAKTIDESSEFMDKAKHFVVPCDDQFIEVIAWMYEVT